MTTSGASSEMDMRWPFDRASPFSTWNSFNPILLSWQSQDFLPSCSCLPIPRRSDCLMRRERISLKNSASEGILIEPSSQKGIESPLPCITLLKRGMSFLISPRFPLRSGNSTPSLSSRSQNFLSKIEPFSSLLPSTSSWEVLRLMEMEERPSLDSLQQERLHGEFMEPIGWVEML